MTPKRKEAPDPGGRFLEVLGLAARARQLRFGIDAVGRAIRGGEAAAVLLADDAPDYVRRRVAGLLESRSLPFARVAIDGDRLGRAVGRERVVAVAITDGSLGQRIMELAGEVRISG